MKPSEEVTEAINDVWKVLRDLGGGDLLDLIQAEEQLFAAVASYVAESTNRTIAIRIAAKAIRVALLCKE